MRDGHEEVALELLGLAQAPRHLAEALGEVPDLRPARDVRHVDVVLPLRDLVRDARELEHRPRQATRQIRGEQHRDDEPREQRNREPCEQRQHARRQLVLRLRDDERAEELLPEVERARDREPRAGRSGRLLEQLRNIDGDHCKTPGA